MNYLGYLGTIFLMISISLSDIVLLRILNTAGSILFVIYGLSINAYPVALLNLYFAGANIYHLSKLKGVIR